MASGAGSFARVAASALPKSAKGRQRYDPLDRFEATDGQELPAVQSAIGQPRYGLRGGERAESVASKKF
jgi:hypothetical protein